VVFGLPRYAGGVHAPAAGSHRRLPRRAITCCFGHGLACSGCAPPVYARHPSRSTHPCAASAYPRLTGDVPARDAGRRAAEPSVCSTRCCAGPVVPTTCVALFERFGAESAIQSGEPGQHLGATSTCSESTTTNRAWSVPRWPAGRPRPPGHRRGGFPATGQAGHRDGLRPLTRPVCGTC